MFQMCEKCSANNFGKGEKVKCKTDFKSVHL